jgi:hypothetical protein
MVRKRCWCVLSGKPLDSGAVQSLFPCDLVLGVVPCNVIGKSCDDCRCQRLCRSRIAGVVPCVLLKFNCRSWMQFKTTA